jgi:XTP/dITP diphosphohydrolase
MHLLLATSNPHKLQEIRAVFREAGIDHDITLLGLDSLQHCIEEPIEDQPTFEGNAVLKATHYAKASGTLCLADDSGLEVDALGGEPGVRSARYAGVTGPRAEADPANNRLLLERLGDTPPEERTARFVCAMTLVAPPDEDARKPLPPHVLVHMVKPYPSGRALITVRGTIEGRIITPDEAADPAAPHRGRGENGFGYDPLFLVPTLGKTTAELSPEHKNSISHRGNATRMMVDWLRRAIRP